MTTIAEAIARVADVPTRQSLLLAQRQLENAAQMFDTGSVSNIHHKGDYAGVTSFTSSAQSHIEKASARSNGDPIVEQVLKSLTAQLHYINGRYLLATNNPKKAVPELEAAMLDVDAPAEHYFWLSLAYTRASRHEEAAEMLETAIAKDENNIEYLEYRDDLEKQGGFSKYLSSKKGDKIKATGAVVGSAAAGAAKLAAGWGLKKMFGK